MKRSSLSQSMVEPYAEALMAIAQDQNLITDFGNDVQLISNTLKESPDLQRVLTAPLIPADAKKDLLNGVFKGKINPIIVNFLSLLVDRKRILLLESICSQFQTLLRNQNRIALAEVIAAVAPSDRQLETLKIKVQELTGAAGVELEIKVNPDLIGGVIIKVGSQVIDASIRGQLRRLTSSLMAGV